MKRKNIIIFIVFLVINILLIACSSSNSFIYLWTEVVSANGRYEGFCDLIDVSLVYNDQTNHLREHYDYYVDYENNFEEHIYKTIMKDCHLSCDNGRCALFLNVDSSPRPLGFEFSYNDKDWQLESFNYGDSQADLDPDTVDIFIESAKDNTIEQFWFIAKEDLQFSDEVVTFYPPSYVYVKLRTGRLELKEIEEE